MSDEPKPKNLALPALAGLVILGSAAAWYWWPRVAPPPVLPPPVATPAAVEAPPAIANPMPAVAPEVPAPPPLPTLADSDAPFGAALTTLPGARGLAGLLVPENLIRHIVASIDNLPRHKLAVELRPLRATGGVFLAEGDEQHATLAAGNALRYAPAMALVRAIDVRTLASLYQRYYPLFQRAYEDLGYPQGYFNDRLVAVIDHLLETPPAPEPLELVRPNVFWQFADPDLEARSAGQKLLLRVGPANAALIRGKLTALRALIAKAK